MAIRAVAGMSELFRDTGPFAAARHGTLAPVQFTIALIEIQSPHRDEYPEREP